MYSYADFPTVTLLWLRVDNMKGDTLVLEEQLPCGNGLIMLRCQFSRVNTIAIALGEEV